MPTSRFGFECPIFSGGQTYSSVGFWLSKVRSGFKRKIHTGHNGSINSEY